MTTLPLGVRFSIGELLALILFAGVGLAAMRNGGATAAAFLFLALLAFMATAIVAFVGVGSARAFAIGFAVSAAIYAGVTYAGGAAELDPAIGALPTTKALAPVREAMTARHYVDLGSGKTLTAAEYEALATNGPQGGGGFGGGFGAAAVVVIETPDVATLMTVGHALIALALGYLGGKFAEAVDRRAGLAVRARSPAEDLAN